MVGTAGGQVQQVGSEVGTWAGARSKLQVNFTERGKQDLTGMLQRILLGSLERRPQRAGRSRAQAGEGEA